MATPCASLLQRVVTNFYHYIAQPLHGITIYSNNLFSFKRIGQLVQFHRRSTLEKSGVREVVTGKIAFAAIYSDERLETHEMLSVPVCTFHNHMKPESSRKWGRTRHTRQNLLRISSRVKKGADARQGPTGPGPLLQPFER